jgi:hypothetical protein
MRDPGTAGAAAERETLDALLGKFAFGGGEERGPQVAVVVARADSGAPAAPAGGMLRLNGTAADGHRCSDVSRDFPDSYRFSTTAHAVTGQR